MASVFRVERIPAGHGELRAQAPSGRESDAFLAPIMAGAFARGVADTFALLAIPAFLLDRDGFVLFATDAARAHGSLTVQAGHLLAGTPADNRVLGRFIEQALHDAASRPTAILKAAGVTLQTLPVPGREPDANQVLHAIVVLV